MTDKSTHLDDKPLTIDTLPTKANVHEIKKAISEMKETVKEEEIPEKIQNLVLSMKMGQESPFKTNLLEKKEIWLSFQPTDKEETKWKKEGFPKLTSLLSFLNKCYDGIENFDLVFFRDSTEEPFYRKSVVGKVVVYVHIDTYLEYGSKINSVIYDLKITKYADKIKKEYSKKVPIAFFNKRPTSELPNELKSSYYGVIEEIINDVEEMPESKEKRNLTSVLLQSKLARDAIKNFTKLSPESPAKQLQLFTQVIPNLDSKDFEILLRKIFSSDVSKQFIETVIKLPEEQLNKISTKLPEMAIMYKKYEKLSKSLERFEKLIEKHKNSKKKNEKAIHQHLAKDFWLLGIEYIDKEILSDISPDGKRTNETKLPNDKRPDFIITRLDGFDKCVVIELEEANDRIFTKSGKLSKEVYDGILQAADYNIEQKFNNNFSKSIAIIGSINGIQLTPEEKKRFKLLTEEFPNVEILTYEHIINKAKTTLNFWDEHNIKKILKENKDEYLE